MTFTSVLKIVLVLSTAFFGSAAFAGEDDEQLPSYGLWVDPAVGFVRPEFGIGGNLVLSTPNRKLFTFRYLSVNEIFSSSNFDTYAEEAAILFGRSRTNRFGTVTGSIGLSVLRGLGHGDYLGMGERCGWFDSGCKEEPQYAENHFKTIGLPLQAQWINNFSWIGFALSLDADLNLEMPLLGITLTLPIGYLPF